MDEAAERCRRMFRVAAERMIRQRIAEEASGAAGEMRRDARGQQPVLDRMDRKRAPIRLGAALDDRAARHKPDVVPAHAGGIPRAVGLKPDFAWLRFLDSAPRWPTALVWEDACPRPRRSQGRRPRRLP